MSIVEKKKRSFEREPIERISARPDTRNRVIRGIYFLELKKKKKKELFDAIYHDLS